MKIGKLFGGVLVATLVCKAVLYGGSKPPLGTRPMRLLRSGEAPLPRYSVLSNWTARGAWIDWLRLGFADGWRFPHGTGYVDAVTLFSQGAVRSGLRAPVFEHALPLAVSLEPGLSSVTHGVTPSNSYLFAWHDALVERDPSNRVDAAIELFRNGSVAVKTTSLSSSSPSTFACQPAVPPPGYHGCGQDADWVRATFPAEADLILAKGYENWVREDFVGINVENGRYLAEVTVAALGEAPCYLECGPYKVNVTSPGTYVFPLEVFTRYETRTYPDALPLEFFFDDGFRGGEEAFEIEGNVTVRPRLLLGAGGPPPDQNHYHHEMIPKVVCTPNHIPLNYVDETPVSLWCNFTNRPGYVIRCGIYQARILLQGSTANIYEAEEPMRLEVVAENEEEAARGYIYIDEPRRNDGRVFFGSNICERVVTNGLAVTHVTAATQSGSTNLYFTAHSVTLPTNVSAYVAVYMATVESAYDEHDCCDDVVGWSVSSSAGDFGGQTSVIAEKNRIIAASSLDNRLYGILFDPFLLAGRRFVPPEGGSLHFDLEATAGNVTDGYAQTCVQIVVYPIDADGNVMDFPSWAGE